MKEPKPGLLKSLFGGRRRAPARAKLPLYIPVASRPDRQLSLDTEGLIDGLLRHDYSPVTLIIEIARLLDKIIPLALAAEQLARASRGRRGGGGGARGAGGPRGGGRGGGGPET